ncbi:MAG: HAMP domain-containing sensor histidine kinase [Gemmatimonadota bacterium]
MQKLSQRIAALTSSITAGLILFAVGLTALLAYRAFDASRAQQQTIEGTLRDYAGFAAFQLKGATHSRIIGMHLGAFDLVVRTIQARGSTPPFGTERAEELIRARRQQCGCLDSVSFFYQLTFADSAISATPSPLATPEGLRKIRDTAMAYPVGPSRAAPGYPRFAGPRPPGPPMTSEYLVTIVSRLGERAYVFTHAVALDPSGKPVVAYGIAVPAEQVVGRAVQTVLTSQPVLPRALTRDMRVDSTLAVTVTTSAGAVVYRSNPAVGDRYAATDSLEPRFGGLRFQVAIDPVAAGRLIIGGLPRSRLPEVLATAFVAVSLLGLLLFQFRRQEELGRLRDDFVSGVSHELRTPLAQIRLLAELLHMGKVPVEERERSLRIIDKEARRLSFLVDGILNFTGARAGRLSPVSTEIATEITEIVCGFEPLAAEQGVRLVTHLERGIVASVDRGALRQVILNLLDNAVRYGPSEQTVTITTASAGASWTLEVADEGPGIPAEEVDRIFAPYYRMKRDAGGAVGGTGIGLAVVRRLVTEHGGRVYVAPMNGDAAAGARFVVELPMDVSRRNAARAGTARVSTPRVNASHVR